MRVYYSNFNNYPYACIEPARRMYKVQGESNWQWLREVELFATMREHMNMFYQLKTADFFNISIDKLFRVKENAFCDK